MCMWECPDDNKQECYNRTKEFLRKGNIKVYFAITIYIKSLTYVKIKYMFWPLPGQNQKNDLEIQKYREVF